MVQVYLVVETYCDYEYSDCEHQGIFSSAELAKKYIQDKKYINSSIEEYELDKQGD